MRSKKHLGILFILTLLASMATISLPSTSSQSTVTFRVVPTVTSGVAPGGLVMVDVYIDAPLGSAIVGWAINIRVNPDVLKPGYDFGPPYGVYWAVSGMEGYFLYDWCMVAVGGKPRWPQGTKFEPGAIDVTAGKITGTIEGIVSWSDLKQGEGASGTDKKLVTLFFTSKSATGYSPIEITEAYYYTSWNTPELDKRVPDVIIHGHYNPQPAHDVAVTYILAPAGAVVGDTVPIEVEVFNMGANNEVFTLTVSYDTTVIEARSVSLNSLVFKTELFSWNTTGVTPGNYTLRAEAILVGDVNPANNVATTTIEIMPIKIYRVDLMRRSAWPEHHHHVEAKYTMTIKLFAIIQNVGTEATYGKVAFTIESPVGVPVGNVETAPQLLAPGEMYGNEKELRYYTSWTVPSYGKYYVTAQVYYDADGDLGTADWTPSPDKPKTFSFSVVP